MNPFSRSHFSNITRILGASFLKKLWFSGCILRAGPFVLAYSLHRSIALQWPGHAIGELEQQNLKARLKLNYSVMCDKHGTVHHEEVRHRTLCKSIHYRHKYKTLWMPSA